MAKFFHHLSFKIRRGALPGSGVTLKNLGILNVDVNSSFEGLQVLPRKSRGLLEMTSLRKEETYPTSPHSLLIIDPDKSGKGQGRGMVFSWEET